MPIQVECTCGRRLNLSDNLAGKTIRCPECSGPVPVPGARPATGGSLNTGSRASSSSRERAPRRRARDHDQPRPSRRRDPQPAQDRWDDVDNFSTGGAVGGYDTYSAGPAYPSAPPGGMSPRVQKSGFPVLPIVIGGGVLGFIFLIGVVAVLVGRAGGNGGGNAAGNGGGANTNPAGNLWVVLSDFQQKHDFMSRSDEVSISYRVVAGTPDPTKRYCVFIMKTGMMGEAEYFELPLSLRANSNASVTDGIPSGPIGSATWSAFAGYEVSEGTFVKVSGDISPQGSSTSVTPLPTAAQVAGQAAVGKLVALANVKSRAGLHGAISLDYEIQGELKPGAQYSLVLSGFMDSYEFDMTSDFRQSRVGTVLLQMEPQMMSANEIVVFEKRGMNEVEVSNRVSK